MQCQYHGYSTPSFPFILDRNLAKANCTGNRVCTSCDTVVLANNIHISKKVGKVYFDGVVVRGRHYPVLVELHARHPLSVPRESSHVAVGPQPVPPHSPSLHHHLQQSQQLAISISN